MWLAAFRSCRLYAVSRLPLAGSLCLMLPASFSLLLVGGAASAVEVYDSGWAVSGNSSQVAPQAAPFLQSRRVPVSELLPRQVIDRLVVPPLPSKSRSAVQPQTQSKRARGLLPKVNTLQPANVASPSATKQAEPTLQQSKPVDPVPTAQGPPNSSQSSGVKKTLPEVDNVPKSIEARTSASKDSGGDNSQRQKLQWRPTRPMRVAIKPDDNNETTRDKPAADDVSNAFSLPGAQIKPAPREESAGTESSDSSAESSSKPDALDSDSLEADNLDAEDSEAAELDAAEQSQHKPSEEQPLREPARFPGLDASSAKAKATPQNEAKKPAKKRSAKSESSQPAKSGEQVKPKPEKTQPRNQVNQPAAKPRQQIALSDSQGIPKSILAPQPASAEALRPLSRNQQYLRRRVRSVLSYYYRRPLNTVQHDPWEVMHGMLPYGLHSRVLDGGPRGKPITAIGHLCFNKVCKRKKLMHLNPQGELDAEVAYGLQGHKGQLLAMLAQCNVSPEYPIRVEGKKFEISDLIRSEQRTCYSKSELTFKLIGLMHYLPSDASWVNDQGETWDFPRLINEERNQIIRGAACGGTHRLSGLALATRTRELRREPLDGEYLQARQFVQKYQQYAFRLQNSDGSLSTEWFRGPGAEEDINRRVRTTGHLLEWLLYSLPDEEVTGYRTVKAVNYLTSLLSSNTNNPWEVGPLAHALHALMLYDQRVFQPHDSPVQLADSGAGASSSKKTASQQTPNYRSITSRVYGSYPSSDEAKRVREEIADRESGGLRGIFGFRSNSSRRSRR